MFSLGLLQLKLTIHAVNKWYGAVSARGNLQFCQCIMMLKVKEHHMLHCKWPLFGVFQFTSSMFSAGTKFSWGVEVITDMVRFQLRTHFDCYIKPSCSTTMPPFVCLENIHNNSGPK